MIPALAMLLILAQRTLFAEGSWASFDRGAACAAVSRAARITTDREAQAQAGFTFDRSGSRHGEFAARFSRPLRAGSTVLLTVGAQPFLLDARDRFAWSRGAAQEAAIIAAVRAGTAMRIEARTPGGGRFVDRYALAGAPGAIDAAAACAARR